MASNTSTSATTNAQSAKPLPPLPVTTCSNLWNANITSALEVGVMRPSRDWDAKGTYNPARPWMLNRNPSNTRIEIGSYIHITNHNVLSFPPTFYAQITNNVYMIRKDYVDAYATVAPDTSPSAIILRIPTKWFHMSPSLALVQPIYLPKNEEENEKYMN